MQKPNTKSSSSSNIPNQAARIYVRNNKAPRSTHRENQQERERERGSDTHIFSIQLQCNVIEEHVDSSKSKRKRKHDNTGSRALGVKPIKIKGGKGRAKRLDYKCLG